MKTLFLGLGRFSHYSDVLRSPLIDALIKEHTIVVLTDYLDSERAKIEKFKEHPNLVYTKITPAHGKLLSFFDKYLRHSFIREFDMWLQTRHWHYRKTHPLSIRFLTAIGGMFPKRLFNARFFSTVERTFSKPSEELTKLFREHKPELLITATPGFSSPFEAELIHAAKRLHITSVAIDINYDNAYSQAKFIRHTDYLCVWNDIMKQEVIDFLHFRADQIFVVGCLRFDHYINDQKEGHLRSREEFLRSKGLDPKKKTIAFTGPSPIMYPPRAELMNIFANLKKNKELYQDPNLFIRLHPHDLWGPYAPHEGTPGIWIERAGSERIYDERIKGQRVEMDEKDLKNLTETLLYVDVVINFVSTMIIEACLFNKPVISIGFPESQGIVNRYEFNKNLVETRCLKLAETPEKLKSAINAYLKNLSEDALERREVVRKYIMFTDGKTWQRTHIAINEILNTRRSNR